MFYARGISFNLAKSVHFKNAVRAIAKFGPSYTPPTYNALRTNLLDKVKHDVDDKLGDFRAAITSSGCTITSDGWTDVNSRPLLNVLQVAPAGAQFLDAINTESKIKTANFVASVLSQAIIKQYKHILWSPCAAHCVDLLLEDIGRFEFFEQSIKKGKYVVTFIANHHKSLALFR
eukprot:jgi/Chlat1/1443/Chrsp12S08679